MMIVGYIKAYHIFQGTCQYDCSRVLNANNGEIIVRAIIQLLAVNVEDP